MNILHIIAIRIAGVVIGVIALIGGALNSVTPASQVSIASPDIAASITSQTTTPDPKPEPAPDPAPKVTVIDIPQDTPPAQAQGSTPAPVAVPVYIVQVQTPTATQTAPAPLPITTTPTMEKEKIEIIEPSPKRDFLAYDWDAYNGQNIPDKERPAGFVFPSEVNSVQLKAVLTAPDGSNDRTSTVKITTSDPTQKEELLGTGDFWGNPKNVYYYAFTYYFKTPGDHEVTFSVGDVSQTVTLTAK